jgi:exodeoxyribonuclease-1
VTSATFYWYDLETTGTDPRWDRIVQFAGVRTDTELNEIGDAAQFYVKCPIDVLPNPAASMVTGLTPQLVEDEGVGELEAYAEIARLFARPNTCVAGFNSLRFDDEFVRYGFYRHFIDPYAREWQGGNSRWDIIDLARAAAALRPAGIQWPLEDGLPSFRLEALAAANDLEHGNAHDASSDVRATLGLARLLRQRQRRLFDYYLSLRDRTAVQMQLRPERPEIRLHVSRMFARERACIAPVMALARHPTNRNSVIVADLGRDERPLLEWDADQLREALFGADVKQRPALKEVRLNRCPFVAPLKVLHREDARRLGMDMAMVQRRFSALLADPSLSAKIRQVYKAERAPAVDPDAALYGAFIGEVDRARCATVYAELRSGNLAPPVEFDDARLNELLFRFRARRDMASLSSAERDRWWSFVKDKLVDGTVGGLTLQHFRSLLAEIDPANEVGSALRRHARRIEQQLRDEGKIQ